MLVLILRSGRAEKVPQTGTRVRASRRMRTAPISGLPEIGRIQCPSRLQPTWVPSCFETHRGALGLWKHLRSHPAAMLLSMRARGATHFGQTKPSGEYACLVRANDQPAAVQNDRRRRFTVSGLLFTMTFATRTCRPH